MRQLRPAFTLCSFILCALIAGPSLARDLDTTQVYQQISELRARAGLNRLSINPQLQAAASDHAIYLLNSGEHGHIQRPGNRYFSGKSATERAAYRGYASRSVKENVSSGQIGYTASLTGLMTAVYHRLAFLSTDIDEIGIASAGTGKDTRYVYVMGNSKLNQLCLNSTQPPNKPHPRRFYRNSCNQPRIIEASEFERNRDHNTLNNPRILAWPAADTRGVPPAFFDEQPDPLPDYSVSGNPITIQVNPLKVASTSLLAFELFDADTGQQITQTRILGQHNDPNKHLNAGEWALFPLQRLQWGHSYQVRAKLQINRKIETLQWVFHTRQLPGRQIIATQAIQHSEVKSAKPVFIYAPPSRSWPRMRKISYQYPQFSHIKSDFIDGNTLRITAHGNPGDQIRIKIDPQRTVILTIVAK